MTTSNAATPKSGLYADPRPHWLALHREEVIDPKRRSSIPITISGIAGTAI